jgi:hypothetical protein
VTSRPRPAASDQRGYALLLVLGVIGMTAAVVGALLSLSLTTSEVGVALERDASVRRAVDGALEAAVAQLRARPDGAGGDSCRPGALPMPLPVDFDLGNDDAGDDVVVGVACTEVPDVAIGALEAEDPDGTVELRGSGGYRGEIAWSTDCATGLWAPACLPWKLSLGVGRYNAVQAQLGGLQPALVHTGAEPLRVGASVLVRGTAAVLRDPRPAEASGPGVLVSERYAQGSAGPFSTAVGGACGILERGNSWGVVGAAVVDDDATPTCGDADAADLDPSPQQGAPFADPPPVGAVPACPGAGPGVVALGVGSYDAARTEQLNALLGGGCPNKTFHFPPGTYRFDADDRDAGANRNALVVADPTVKVVFGTARGWDPGAGVPAGDDDFPLACDPDAPGASVALTARTSLRHEAGRVAICPAQGAGEARYPALVQTGTVPPEVEATGATSSDWNDPDRLVAPASAATYSRDNSFNCTVTLGWCESPRRTFRTTWRHSGTGPLRGLRIALTGGIVGENSGTGGNVGNFDAGRFVEFAVRPGGSDAVACTVRFRTMSELFSSTTSYDLFSDSGCRSELTSETQLDGARIDVSVWYSNLCVIGGCYRQSLDLTGVALVTNPLLGTGASASGAGWSDASAVLAADGTAAEVACTPVTSLEGFVTYEERDCGTQRERTLTLSGLGDRSGQLAPGDQVSGLRVLVRYQPPTSRVSGVLCRTCRQTVDAHGGGHQWNRPRSVVDGTVTVPGRVTFRLTTPAGECTRSFDGTVWVSTGHDITYDLADSPDCARLVPTVGQLSGGSLAMTVELPCDPDSTAARCMVQPLSAVDQVAVLAAVDRGTRTHSWVTIDGDAGASFHAAGSALLPNTDLDVRWRGTASDEPLFRESLVLAALGSHMVRDAVPGDGVDDVDMGTVCCSRLLVPVRLEACVDGEVRGEAVVRVGRPDADGVRPVAVLDWDLAASRGACSGAATAVLAVARGG